MYKGGWHTYATIHDHSLTFDVPHLPWSCGTAIIAMCNATNLAKDCKKKQMPKSFMLLNQAIFLLDFPDSRKPTSRHFGCNVKVSSITCSLCHVFKEFNTFILSTFWFSPMIIYYRKNNHWIFIYILVNGYYYSIGIINRILIY